MRVVSFFTVEETGRRWVRNFLKSVENYHKTEGDSVPLLCKHPTADSVGHVIPPGGNRALPSECRQLGLASCNIGLSRTESLIIYCQKIISAGQKFVFSPFKHGTSTCQSCLLGKSEIAGSNPTSSFKEMNCYFPAHS